MVDPFETELRRIKAARPDDDRPPEEHIAQHGTATVYPKREAPAQSGTVFEVFTILDIINMPPTKPLIAGVLPAGEVSCLFGELNSFKSFIAISMLCSLATGTPWFGLRGRKRAGCLYRLGRLESRRPQAHPGLVQDNDIPRERWGCVKIIKVRCC